MEENKIERTEEEIANDAMIPEEIKNELAEKVNKVINNIGLIERAISNGIDDVVEESENPITVTEINAALINVLMKMNKREIGQLINI